MKYLQRTPVVVRGTVTGRIYRFSPLSPEQILDARDAEALLLTRLFRRA